MRVPEAQTTARIGTLNTAQASPDDFGAGIGRAVENSGQAVRQVGSVVSDIALDMQQKRSTREVMGVYNAFVMDAEKLDAEKIRTVTGADTDQFSGDGFAEHVSTPLKTILEKHSANLSPFQRDRLVMMSQNYVLSFERRALAHYTAEQEKVNRQTALDAAANLTTVTAGENVRNITKNPDGTVTVDLKASEGLFNDAIAAMKVAMRRSGIPEGKTTLPDGTERETAVVQARSGIHAKTIETLIAQERFDEADGYLKAITEDKTYQGDLDDKQVKASQDAIRSGREQFKQRAEQDSFQRYYDAVADNQGSPLDETQIKALNLHPGTAEKVAKMQNMLDMPRRAELLSQKVQAFKRKAGSEAERAEITALAASLPTEIAKPYMDTFNLKIDIDKSQSARVEGANRIISALEALPWDGRDKKSAELAEAKALSLSRYHEWVEREKPSNEEMINYVNTAPDLVEMREARDYGKYKAELKKKGGEWRGAPGELPTLGNGGVKKYWVPDDDLKKYMDWGTNAPRMTP